MRGAWSRGGGGERQKAGTGRPFRLSFPICSWVSTGPRRPGFPLSPFSKDSLQSLRPFKHCVPPTSHLLSHPLPQIPLDPQEPGTHTAQGPGDVLAQERVWGPWGVVWGPWRMREPWGGAPGVCESPHKQSRCLPVPGAARAQPRCPIPSLTCLPLQPPP